MDDLEMILNIHKDWPDDAHVGNFSSSMEEFKEMEKALMDDNEDVITSLRLLNMDENNYRVYVNFVSFIFQVFFSLQV
jgi:hypothetical protein